MAHFFTDWATWEKLVLILACAMILTVMLGCARLGYTHWRLRKHVAIDRVKQDLATHRRMSPGTDGTDTLFGLAAMERGPAHAEIWNSGNNTPESNSPNVSNPSLSSRVRRKDYEVETEQLVPKANHSQSDIRPASAGHEHSAAAAAAEPRQCSYDPSSEPSIAKPAKSRYPPTFLSRFNDVGEPPLLRTDPASSTLRALDAVYNTSDSLRRRGTFGASENGRGSNDSSNQSSYDGIENDSIAASAPGLLNQQAPTPSRRHSADFHLMHSHRLSQAAEIGQLAPRARRPGFSGEWASIANATPAPAALEGHDYLEQPNSPSDSQIEALLPEVRRSGLPDVTPFTEFCGSAPHTGPYRPVSADGGLVVRSNNWKLGIYSTPQSPSIAATTPELPAYISLNSPEEGLQQPNRRSFERRPSAAVIRGHGTGFEILKPGTFNPPTPNDLSAAEQSRSAPPVSLYNSLRSRSRSSSADSHHKLQKKRRPSTESEKRIGMGAD